MYELMTKIIEYYNIKLLILIYFKLLVYARLFWAVAMASY